MRRVADALDAGDEPFGSVLADATGTALAEDRNRVAGGDRTRHPELALARWAAEHLTPEERRDVLGSYLRRLVHPDPAVHIAAARAWSVYEGSCSTLLPSPDTVASFAQDRTALGLARIEAYYFAHDLFLPAGGLLGGMNRIGHLPAEIVQGRYDMICPARTAFEPQTGQWSGNT